MELCAVGRGTADAYALRHMKTNLVGFAVVALLGACAAQSSQTEPGDDELAGEDGDGEMAKADAIDNFDFLEVRKIGAFECNGVGSCTHLELDRANRSTTTCADGSTAETCSVRTLDLTKLSLSATARGKVMDALQAQARDPDLGTQVLARGKYVHGTNPLYPNVDWVTFQPSEVWVAVLADGSTDGTFVRVTDNGRRCITAPCASNLEGRLNSVKTMNIHGLDFGDDVASSVTSKVFTAVAGADGAIVVGDRTHGKVSGQTTTLRGVSQVYLRVK